MTLRTETVRFSTGSQRVSDITADLDRFIQGCEGDGIVHVFCPHATAGLALMETNSGSEADLEEAIDRLLPREDIYRHRHGSKGHGADHLLPAFISPSTMIPVVNGRAALGTWQSLVLVDPNVDNPTRTIRFSFLPGQ